MRQNGIEVGRFVRSSSFGAAMGLLVVWALAAPQAHAIPKGDITVHLEPVASGLTAPVFATHPSDDSGRLFIVDQTGKIWIVKNGTLLPAPFLDISIKLPVLNAAYDERGLLGLAFHPNYRTNGRFFVRYSAPRTGSPGEPCFGTSRGCHREVLAEYSVSTSDPDKANPGSEIILFTVDKPQFNHNGGGVAFGPDGLLYFSLGDGGGANDGLADVPPSHGPIGNGQNIETALGAMLRIDVDGGAPYAIPRDNPFVGGPGLDEIYAYGMRTPYSFSFDDGPGGDGRLMLADVGQDMFEEIDIVSKGGNYGWVIREGLHCFDPFNPSVPPASCASTGAAGEPLLDPIVEYAHPDGGIAVVGGFVYRGLRSPALVGKYVFGDFSASFAAPGGRLYYLVEPVPGSFAIQEFHLGAADLPYGKFLKGIGEDANGEIYLCASTRLGPSGTAGVVERLVAVNRPPVALCREVQVSAGATCQAAASVDNGSSDPDNEPVSLEQTPAGPYGLGVTPVVLTVRDGAGASASCQASVTVTDTTPPQISVRLDPDTLWPPNHRMIDVTATVTVTDNCGTPAFVLTSVTSSEADDGVGDGNTVSDIQGVLPGTADVQFKLRAERAGSGFGRVYTSAYTARDGSGNETTRSGFAVVPHDQHGVVDPVMLSIEKTASGTTVSWTGVAGAGYYNVIRGNLESIMDAGPVIDLGAVLCVVAHSAALSTVGNEDTELPRAGGAFFYLVEYNDGTSSSYGTESASKPRAPASGACQ